MQIAMKTTTYSIMHMVVAFLVAYALSDSWKLALSIGMIETTIQTVAYFFHERLWARRFAKSQH
jgi:uncharacterized membrane protein